MRKRKEFERPEGGKSDRLVVIAAEGRYTENIYFESMKDSLSATDVHVVVLHRHTNASNPQNVFMQIDAFKKEYSIGDQDQLWVVVDHDKWQDKTLASVAKLCQQDANLRLCVSNPCFELWLILHLEDVASYSATDKRALAENKKNSINGDSWAKRRLRKLMGSFQESNYDTDLLLPHVNEAIQRAEALDVSPTDRWPQTIGTRAHLLAQSMK